MIAKMRRKSRHNLSLHHARNNYQLEKFNKGYNRLNPQQKKAVNAIEGPVMVIAGTGKTQILSAHIGKILWGVVYNYCKISD